MPETGTSARSGSTGTWRAPSRLPSSSPYASEVNTASTGVAVTAAAAADMIRTWARHAGSLSRSTGWSSTAPATVTLASLECTSSSQLTRSASGIDSTLAAMTTTVTRSQHPAAVRTRRW